MSSATDRHTIRTLELSIVEAESDLKAARAEVIDLKERLSACSEARIKIGDRHAYVCGLLDEQTVRAAGAAVAERIACRERDLARADAHWLAHAYRTDNRPPEELIRRAENYPTRGYVG